MSLRDDKDSCLNQSDLDNFFEKYFKKSVDKKRRICYYKKVAET